MALKLLIDENVRSGILAFFEGLGHDVKKLPAGVSDTMIAQCAAAEKRILITHDLDFSNIFVYPAQNYSGIVVLRILPPLANTIISALANLFAELKEDGFDKKLIILEPSGFRIREAEE